MVIMCRRSNTAPNFLASLWRKIVLKSSNAPMTRTSRNVCAVCSAMDTSACTSLKRWNPTGRPTTDRNPDITVSHHSRYARQTPARRTEAVTDFVWWWMKCAEGFGSRQLWKPCCLAETWPYALLWQVSWRRTSYECTKRMWLEGH